LPTPLGPLKSMTLRKLAVCCNRLQARWAEGGGGQNSNH
jgi:hypothetical protein